MTVADRKLFEAQKVPHFLKVGLGGLNHYWRVIIFETVVAVEIEDVSPYELNNGGTGVRLRAGLGLHVTKRAQIQGKKLIQSVDTRS